MKQQMSRLQFVFLALWLIVGTGILTLPFTIGQITIRDGWISAILLLPGGAVVITVIALFRRVFPNQSLVEALHEALGPFVGRAASLWFIYMIFVTECFVLREGSVFLSTTVLPSTPNYIVAGAFILPVAYVTYQGAEVLGRMAEIITPIGVGVILVLFMLALPYLNPSYLQPVLADGWSPVVRADVVPWAYMWETMFFLQFRGVPGQWMTKGLLITTLLISAIGVIAEFTVIAVLGPGIRYSAYPLLEVVRTIRIADFIERLDTLYVMGVVTTIFLKLSVIHFAFTTAIQNWFAPCQYRRMVWSSAILLWAGSFFLIHNSNAIMDIIMKVVWGYFTSTGLAGPLLAVIVQRWRQHRAIRR
ncbi:GerAB/ArcD/ProY family transporter [Kyrpidia tusciae]|uniref:Spore germination protein n=1 Tax=Kyrpidia tusciae (strain DSM 2912 / NBRC 15312 / T2) TaxID=562970 RepID=D5WRX2_KYRT2|nr:endospore germination permease [Kyrpidia tusciae]ADG06924.1 spore germination protein [Kyrpidia tusciae DSM 2912]